MGLSRCKHEPPFDPATCGDAQTIEEMKHWVLFKPGTYWIYEEENTGYIDTVTVTEYFDGLSSGGFAAFGCVMHSTFDGYNYDYWFNDSYSGDCGSNESCICRKVLCSKSVPGDFVGEEFSFVFPLKVSNYQGLWWGMGGGDYGFTTITNFPFTCAIEQLEFSICTEFTIDNSVQNDWKKVIYTLAHNVGIVSKQNIEENQKWNIKEYQIIQ